MSNKPVTDQLRKLLRTAQIALFDFVEIGKLLGINEGTSRSQYARARALLISWIKKNNEINFKTGAYAGK